MNIPHLPVLKDEIIALFKDINDGYVVDCTLGYGGHTSAILSSNPNIKMICCDQDDEAIEFSTKRLEAFNDRVKIIKSRFSNIIPLIKQHNIKGILADIGVSSLQLDKSERGFSFDSDVLDMRMSKDTKLTAYEVVNDYSFEELMRVMRDYSDLRDIKKISHEIYKARPIKSAKDLAQICAKYIKSGKINPATLVFQAIRIEVNDELGELKTLLQSIKEANLKDVKVAIISFHSLEDRIVKETFKQWSKDCICPDFVMRCECRKGHAFGEVLTKKPIIPTAKEIKQNPRSRSSKMRVFQTYE